MYLEELTQGRRISLAPVTITKEEMVAFARAYDPIPLHTDEAYAKTTRFGQLIAPGVMSFMAVWVKYLEQDFLGEQLVAGKSTKIEWFLPVFAGDVLTGTAYVSNVTVRNDYNGIAEVTIDVVNQDGKPVLRDVTEAIVQRRPRT